MEKIIAAIGPKQWDEGDIPFPSYDCVYAASYSAWLDFSTALLCLLNVCPKSTALNDYKWRKFIR